LGATSRLVPSRHASSPDLGCPTTRELIISVNSTRAGRRSSAPPIRTERKIFEKIQRAILENYYFIPVFRATMQASEPRIDATKWQDEFPTVTTAYAYPWEDIRLKS